MQERLNLSWGKFFQQLSGAYLRVTETRSRGDGKLRLRCVSNQAYLHSSNPLSSPVIISYGLLANNEVKSINLRPCS